MPLKLIHGTPELGPRRAGPASLRCRAGARAGPRRPDPRRRLRLRARALRRGRGARRRGDDLRSAVPHRRHRRRGAAGGRALPGPAAAGDRGRGRARAAAGSGPCGARPPGPASPGPSRGCSTSCRAPGSSRTRSRPSAATLEGSAYLSDIALLFSGYAEVRDAQRPRRRPPDRPRGDRAAAIRQRLLGRSSGLPLRARRPHPQPARPGRGAGGGDGGDRRVALRGRQHGPGRARAAARRSCRPGSAPTR